MNELELKQALAAYTQPAADGAEELKGRVLSALPGRRHGNRMTPVLAAACAALVLGMVVLTPAGQAMAAAVREEAAALWERLFPPRTAVITPEGVEETVTFQPQVEEPALAAPGFNIYVDEATYLCTREADGTTLIHPLPDYDPTTHDLPPCQLRIYPRAELSPEEALEQAEAILTEKNGEVTRGEDGRLWAAAGSDWNSVVDEVWVVPDGREGCFVLHATYFLEAAEGHGSRLAAMADTFQVLSGRPDQP